MRLQLQNVLQIKSRSQDGKCGGSGVAKRNIKRNGKKTIIEKYRLSLSLLLFQL